MIKIYSVGVWNENVKKANEVLDELKFTPLEFETCEMRGIAYYALRLKFTPLEFETPNTAGRPIMVDIKIYSVGVWNYLYSDILEALKELKFTPLEFETKVCV